MSNQDSPTPAAPAEVCERLKQALGDFEVFAQADGTGDYVECRINKEDLTSALLLIEQGEKERERLDYVHRMGLRFGMMKSSDKAEPYLMHTWTEDSDHERMFREWCDSIGWQEQLAAATERVKQLERKAQYFAYLIGTGRCPVITKWDGVERHGYVSCIGVSSKAFEHALELAAQKLADIAARAQPTPESK